MIVNHYSNEYYGADPLILMENAKEYLRHCDSHIVTVSIVIVDRDEYGYRCLVSVTVSDED